MHIVISKNFWGGYRSDKEWAVRFPAAYLHTPWWHIVIGRWEDRLFSERNGYVWCKRIGKLRLTIRRMKSNP